MQQDYQDRKYEVIEYDLGWPGMFMENAHILQEIFGTDALQIEHIGSTSVPGMAGKPLVDILILVENVRTAEKHKKAMQQAGFTSFGDLLEKGSYLFRKEPNGIQLVNVHVFPKDHPHVREMLGLRDFLRTHPEKVHEYTNLKRMLFEKYPRDYAHYRKEKDEYMRGLLKIATRWYQEEKA